jgi:hypothetical protein
MPVLAGFTVTGGTGIGAAALVRVTPSPRVAVSSMPVPVLAEGLMATMLSDDTLTTLTAPRSTAEPWFCIRYQVCLKFN